MKLLVVGEDFPFPPRYGAHLRLAQIIEVASGLGETDVFSFVMNRRQTACVLPVDIKARRLETVPFGRPDYSVERRLRWLVSPGMPHEIIASRSREISRAFAEWVDPPYDVVWFSRATTFELLDRPVPRSHDRRLRRPRGSEDRGPPARDADKLHTARHIARSTGEGAGEA